MRIGVLVAHFDDSFQRDLWKAVQERARARGVSTLAFLGHGLGALDPGQATSNVAYRMAGAPVVDGLIVFSNNLGTFSGPGAVADLVRDRGLPAVSIGLDVAGAATVRVEGGTALGEVVDHLVTAHHRRHFALVTGPTDHPESREREAAVRDALARGGVEGGAVLVVDGGFSREWAQEAVGTLVAAEPRIDAVVCLNDHMAVGVIEGLALRGLRVPEDVSVVGFDDLGESRWRRPALTTVRQPTDAMGAAAVDLVLELLAGGPRPHLSLQGRPVYRRSCGCPGEPGREEAAFLRREVEDALVRSDRLTKIRDYGVRLQGTFRLEALARQWEETLGALGLPEGALVLFEGTAVPLGKEVPDQGRVVRWSPGGGLETQTFPTVQVFPPGHRPRVRGDWLILPLVYRDEALGYLIVRCADEDVLVYETLRDQVSTAVKATLLMEASRTHEDLLEREVQEISHRTMQSIGQDIHDDLCQHLAGISMLVTVLEERTPAADRGPIQEIGALLGGALDRARQYARTLYPPGLEDHGLVPALQDLVESLQKTSGGVALTLQADPGWRVDDHRVALQLYRIIQESLGNAIRHSGSDLVLVRLTQADDRLEAEVRDFGQGLGTPAPGQGMGLKILRYRAQSIGARLEFHNLDPGLCVSCVLPAGGSHA